MKNLFLSLCVLFSVSSAFAAEGSSIELTFNGPDGFSTDVYNVPNQNDSAVQNLIKLSSESVESICYKLSCYLFLSSLCRDFDFTLNSIQYSILTQHGLQRTVKRDIECNVVCHKDWTSSIAQMRLTPANPRTCVTDFFASSLSLLKDSHESTSHGKYENINVRANVNV